MMVTGYIERPLHEHGQSPMHPGQISGNIVWEPVRLALGSERAARVFLVRAIDKLGSSTDSSVDAARAARFAAIVTACDVDGISGVMAARRLGLSPAQLYRERRAARSRLGRLIGELLTETLGFHAESPLSLFELELAEADAAGRGGAPQKAVAQLQSVLHRGVHARGRVEILGRLAVLYGQQGRLDLARAALDDALRSFSRRPHLADRHRLDAAGAALAAIADDAPGLKEIAARLVPEVAAAASPAQLESAAGALIDLALLYLGRSNVTEAREAFTQVDALLCNHPHPPVHLRAKLLNAQAQMNVTAPATIGLARAQARTAFHLASGHGLTRDAWLALHTMVDNHLGVLDLRSVLAYASYLLRSAQQVGEPEPIAMASLMLAATQAQMGALDDALRRVESCRPSAAGSTTIASSLLQGYVLGLHREYARALDVVKQARTTAERSERRNLVGVGLLYESILLEASGSTRGAREAAIAAADVLEHGTSPYHLASVYGRIYRLSGDRQYQRRARALSSTFRIAGDVLQTLAPSHASLAEIAFGGRLTPRQTEVALLICAGKSNREIARETGTSESTAAHHVEAILRRLGLRARWQLVEMSV